MYKTFQNQIVLMHATYLIVGGWACYTWTIEMHTYYFVLRSFGRGKLYSIWPVYIPDQLIFLFSLAFILKAVSI